jgi:hypothetical protein
VLLVSAPTPVAVLLLAVLLKSAVAPVAVLLLAVLFFWRALAPVAVFPEPVVLALSE